MKRRLALVSLCVASILATVEAVPSPPTNLTVQASGNVVTLSWTAPVGVITGYRLEAGTAPGLSNVAIVILGLTTTLSASAPAGTYYVRVKATDATGASAASNEATVVIGGGSCQSPPGPPTGLSSSVVNMSVTLTWTAASGCAATRYVLLAGTGSGSSNVGAIPVGNVLSFSAVAPAGTYYVRVTAANAFGSSAPSNEVVLVVGGGPVPPPGPGPLPPLGIVTAIIDGVPFSGTLNTARIATGNNLVMTALPDPSRLTNILTISAPAQVGTHVVGVPGVTGVFLLSPTVNWLAAGPQGSGSVTISTLTATNATGTFAFSLVGNPGLIPAIKVVTNGVFNARLPTP